MVKGWLDVGDKIVIKRQTYIVIIDNNEYVLSNCNRLTFGIRFSTLSELNEYVYSPKQMLQAAELRLGNLMYFTKYDIPQKIKLRDIRRFLGGEKLFKPIPITELFLNKLGFENMEKFPLKYVQRMKPDSLSEFEPVIVVGDLWLTGIRHIHQVQNLFFDLTGEELTLSVT